MRNASLTIALFVGLSTACTIQAAPAPSGEEGGNSSSTRAKHDGTANGTKTPAAAGTNDGTPAGADNGGGTSRNIRFGVAPQYTQNYVPPASGPANVDAVVVGDWLIENGFTDTHTTKLRQILDAKKTPYVFGYILTAMTKQGLGATADCDGDPSKALCQQGAEWLRSHIDSDIVPKYLEAAQKISALAGTSEVLIHLEPDYFQFSEKAQAKPLTRDESNGFMNKIIAAIKSGCSSCRAVADFSPWFSPDKTAWATTAKSFYEGWDKEILRYVGVTGKQFAFTEAKVDNFGYAEIVSEMGLPLVIMDGYTFGGAAIDVDKSWLDENALAKAQQMGIAWVFLSQQGDVAGFDAFLASRTTAP